MLVMVVLPRSREHRVVKPYQADGEEQISPPNAFYYSSVRRFQVR